MSGATYRIDVTHEPSSPDDIVPFVARASRFSGEVEFTVWAPSAAEAVNRMRCAIQMNVEAPRTYYMDDAGNLVEPPPQPVKA